MRIKSLSFRLIAGAGVWIVAALFAGVLAVSAFLESYAERSLRERLNVYLEALIGASETTGGGDRVLLVRELDDPRFERPFSGWYWQIGDGEEAILRSRSLWDEALTGTAAEAAGQAAWLSARGPENQRLRLLVRDVTLPDSDRVFRYIVAAEERVITREIRPVRVTLVWLLAALAAGLIVALFIQVRFGLRPLRHMQKALADVRAGKAERLEGEFVEEIAPVAAELNALIVHNAAILERARRHLGDLAHGLKTPLAVLNNEASARRDIDPALLAQQVELMTRLVDRHLARARSAGTRRVLGARTPLAPVVETLRRALSHIHAEKSLDIQVEIAADAIFAGEREDCEEIFGNIMDNAVKWARSQVRISIQRSGALLHGVIDDDGPGLPEDKRREVLMRGARLDESSAGSGLGLSIVADLVELYEGSIELDDAPGGGLRVALTLPAASTAT